MKLLTIRNNNVLKFKFILYEWYDFIDIVFQYIVFYNFVHNDVIEKKIKQ